jgi:hypothetical protein
LNLRSRVTLVTSSTAWRSAPSDGQRGQQDDWMVARESVSLRLGVDPGWGGAGRGWARTGASFMSLTWRRVDVNGPLDTR